MNRLQPWLSWPLAVLLLLVGMVTVVFGVLRVGAMAEFSATGIRPEALFDARYVDHPLVSYLHIASGSVFMLLGPFQFVPALRRRWLRWHRWSGRLFVACALVAGTSALYMALALPAFGGLTTQAATFFFGLYLLYATLKAFYHVRRRQIVLHREWMIRAFAVGLAVSTIRLYIVLFQIFAGYSFAEVFGVSFWLAFCTHALLAELWIAYTRPSRRPGPMRGEKVPVGLGRRSDIAPDRQQSGSG